MAALVPLDPDAHRQAEALGRRTYPHRAKGAATEPLGDGARTYGCTHAPARGPEGRRSSSVPSRRRVLRRVCYWQRDEKGKGRGDAGEASQATGVTVAIASGAPAGGVGLPAAARDRDSGEWGEESSAARVTGDLAVGAVLIQRRTRWTIGLNPTASSTRCWHQQATGRTRARP
jgi:hypothetical protein